MQYQMWLFLVVHLKKIGGHNPIEPAFFGCKIISGKNIFNQKSLFDCIKTTI